MAKRKDKVTKDELRGLRKGRSDAIEILEKLPSTPDSSDILTEKMKKITSDLTNEIIDKLAIFLGDNKFERFVKSGGASKIMSQGFRLESKDFRPYSIFLRKPICEDCRNHFGLIDPRDNGEVNWL